MTQTFRDVKAAAAQTTYTHTFAATAAGVTLVLEAFLSGGATIATIVDSAGGSLAGGQWVARQTANAFGYDRISGPSGITTVAVTFSSADYLSSVSGWDNIISFDKTASSLATTTTPTSGAVATTSFADELALGSFFTGSGTSQNFAAGSGWTTGTGTGVSAGGWSGGGNSAFCETQILSATGTPAATATCTNSGVASMILTYRITASGGAGGYTATTSTRNARARKRR